MRAATADPQFTVEQAAKMMNVSVRAVYLAKRLGRLDRPDLEAKLWAGELSLNKALEIAEGRKPPTARDRLVKVWNAASDDDRAWIIAAACPRIGRDAPA